MQKLISVIDSPTPVAVCVNSSGLTKDVIFHFVKLTTFESAILQFDFAFYGLCYRHSSNDQFQIKMALL